MEGYRHYKGRNKRAVSDPDKVRAAIAEGIARTLWVLQWSRYEDEQGRSYSDYDLETIAPETPEEVFETADCLIAEVERVAIADSVSFHAPMDITRLYAQARESNADTPFRFGAAIAHQHQGSDCRWDDSHERALRFEVPAMAVDLEELAAEATPPTPSLLGRLGPRAGYCRSGLPPLPN